MSWCSPTCFFHYQAKWSWFPKHFCGSWTTNIACAERRYETRIKFFVQRWTVYELRAFHFYSWSIAYAFLLSYQAPSTCHCWRWDFRPSALTALLCSGIEMKRVYIPRVAWPRSYSSLGSLKPSGWCLLSADTVITDNMVGMREATNFPVVSGAFEFKALLI